MYVEPKEIQGGHTACFKLLTPQQLFGMTDTTKTTDRQAGA
jgi:hypothetical protein